MADSMEKKRGALVVLTCMLANNCTLGLAYGTFGAMVVSNEAALGVARDSISFGMSAQATAVGVSALLMGNLVRRMTARLSIAIGLVAAACAFTGLSLSSSLTVALTMWALLGFAAAMAAILGPITIAAEYFPGHSGKVLGLVNLPVMLFVSPWAVTEALPLLGRQGTYLAMAALQLPLLLMVLRLPAGSARANEPQNGASSIPASSIPASSIPASSIFGQKEFWFVTLGIALIAGTGTAYTVHAIPYVQSRGLSAQTAALVMAIYSGAGLLGVPVFGWLADKFGAARTLAISAAMQSVCWAGMALAPTASFFFFSAILGSATTPLTTLHGAAMTQMFGKDGASQSTGYGFAIKLPFLFVASPAMGYAFVLMSDYRPAFLMSAAALVVGVILLMLAAMLSRSRRNEVVPG